MKCTWFYPTAEHQQAPTCGCPERFVEVGNPFKTPLTFIGTITGRIYRFSAQGRAFVAAADALAGLPKGFSPA